MNSAGNFLRLTILVAAGSLTACSGSLDDARYPTGSSSVVASQSYDAIYTANTDQGTISRVDLASRTVTEVQVGLEPVRLARSGNRIFATLRGERSLAVLSDEGGALRVESRIELGAEPFGVVADEKGRFVYVANQLGGTVAEIDAETLLVTREFALNGQPRFLALHPAGKHLYVGGAVGGALTDINLRSGEVLAMTLPENTGADPETFEPVTLSGRITGDLSVSPDGTALAIPALYVNNVSPVGDPSVGEVPSDGYAGSDGTRRFNPGVVLIVTNADGKLRTEYTETLSLQGFGGGATISSYPSSLAFTPDSESLVVTLEGSDAALAVQLPASIGTSGRSGGLLGSRSMEFDDFGFGGSSMNFASTTTLQTGSAPRGVAFIDDDNSYVHNGFDYSVGNLDLGQALAGLDGDCCSGGRGGMGAPMQDFAEDEFFGEDGMEFDDSFPFVMDEPIVVAEEVLSPELAEGRKLFFSASNDMMALPGAGVSCASCHFDGRTDGLTWQFDEGPRQTPSLAGNVSQTAPVTWVDSVPTVFDEVVVTSQGRMGGQGLDDERAAMVAAYVDSTPLPDTALRGSQSDSVLRGKALFESAEIGCADCHSGETYSDNEPYDMFGLDEVRTRSLRGVAASAPYLHDGSAPTLRAVLEAVRTGEMGDTGGLNEAQMTDLEAYLASL